MNYFSAVTDLFTFIKKVSTDPAWFCANYFFMLLKATLYSFRLEYYFMPFFDTLILYFKLLCLH